MASTAASNVAKIFNNLSYEPVLDSEAAIKAWIETQNKGLFSSFIANAYQKVDEKQATSFEVKNPSTGAVLAKVVNADKKTLDLAVDSCKNAAKSWKALSNFERGRILYK